MPVIGDGAAGVVEPADVADLATAAGVQRRAVEHDPARCGVDDDGVVLVQVGVLVAEVHGHGPARYRPPIWAGSVADSDIPTQSETDAGELSVKRPWGLGGVGLASNHAGARRVDPPADPARRAGVRRRINLQAVIDATLDGRLPAKVVAVVSDRADAGALSRAGAAGIPAVPRRAPRRRGPPRLRRPPRRRRRRVRSRPRRPRRVDAHPHDELPRLVPQPRRQPPPGAARRAARHPGRSSGPGTRPSPASARRPA